MKAVILSVTLAWTLVSGAAAAPAPAPAAPAQAVTLPFVHDAGRVLVTLAFQTPDGRQRDALAWVNMGTPRMALSPGLARDIGFVPGQPLRFRFGALPIEVPPVAVADDPPELVGEDALKHLFGPRTVEAILPASVLMHYQLVLDYPARRMTLASPGLLHPQGVATPFRLDPDSGVIAVDAVVGGDSRALVVDAGAAFTWLRGDVTAGWLAAHPDWRRAEGAVGASNMGMVDLALETRGTLLNLPDMVIAGRLTLSDASAFGTAPLLCGLCDRVVGDLFWDGWAKTAPGPVAGWIGDNLLGDFRLTVDYPNHTLYWLRRRPAGPRGIALVGLTLVRRDGAYRVGGIVSKDGRATVDGVAAGDRLVAIDGRDPQGVGSDDVLAALGGAPGTLHHLVLDRNGLAIEVEAPVTAF